MRYCCFIFLWFLGCITNLLAQTKSHADSLKSVLKTTTNDSSKIQILNRLCQESDSLTYAEQALQIAEQSGSKTGISLSLLDIGRYYYFNDKADSALSNLTKSIRIAEETGEKSVLVSAYKYMGYIYRPNDPSIAEEYYNKSLKLARTMGDSLSESYALSALGNIYENIYTHYSESNIKALSYYLESLRIREKIGSDEEIASSLNETSRVYDLLGQYDKELALRLKGLEFAKKAGSIENIVYLSSVLGNDYSTPRLHNYKKALEYHRAAYDAAKTMQNNSTVLFFITKGIANDYYLLGDMNKSIGFYRQAMDINDSISGENTKNVYNLSVLKEDLEKGKLILKNTEISKEKAEASKQATLRDASIVVFIFVLILIIIILRGYRIKQISNRKLASKHKRLEAAYKELSLSEQKFKAITESMNDVFYLFNIVEKRYEYISPNCVELLGVGQKFFYDGNSMKVLTFSDDLPSVKDANVKVDSGIAYDIEYRIKIGEQLKWVSEKSFPIFDSNGVPVKNSGILRDISIRKGDEEVIRIKTREIQDSIEYASNIQKAILTPKDQIAPRFNEFFILSKPKDIVGGDFYFFRETANALVLAVADCTGHGVPGGFMSMLGNAVLNDIINNNKDITPAKTLDKLRDMIIKVLNQTDSYISSKDGMDIALLFFDKDEKVVQYAGANIPLYIFQQGVMQSYSGDKLTVGINIGSNTDNFTNHRINLSKGDIIYLASDGYADQFGGSNCKKFSKKQLRDLLLTIYDKKTNEQEKILNKVFEDWKGELAQIDDVMILGVRV